VSREEDVVTADDIESILKFHQVESAGLPHTEQLAATINFALDVVLSKIVTKMREEEDG